MDTFDCKFENPIALDKINLTNYQFGVYPLFVVCGISKVSENIETFFDVSKCLVFKSNNANCVLASAFNKILQLYYKHCCKENFKLLEIDVEQQTFRITDEPKPFTVKIIQNDLTFDFYEDEIKEFIQVFCDIILKTFSYHPQVEYMLKQFLKLSTSCDFIDQCSEEEIVNVLKKVKYVKINHYLCIEVIVRHKELLCNIKRILIFLDLIDQL